MLTRHNCKRFWRSHQLLLMIHLLSVDILAVLRQYANTGHAVHLLEGVNQNWVVQLAPACGLPTSSAEPLRALRLRTMKKAASPRQSADQRERHQRNNEPAPPGDAGLGASLLRVWRCIGRAHPLRPARRNNNVLAAPKAAASPFMQAMIKGPGRQCRHHCCRLWGPGHCGHLRRRSQPLPRPEQAPALAPVLAPPAEC